jgi:hypothetical protein
MDTFHGRCRAILGQREIAYRYYGEINKGRRDKIMHGAAAHREGRCFPDFLGEKPAIPTEENRQGGCGWPSDLFHTKKHEPRF